ncbi:MAG: PIG-L family deacetylase [Verrucomicrobiota bacterium]
MPASAVVKSTLLIACLASVIASRAEPLLLPPPSKGERIVIIAPHPDDEALGCGGLIQQAIAVGADVRVIYLTNGDHNQIAFKLYSGRLHLGPKAYIKFGERRRVEATAATTLLGLSPSNLIFLGYPDWGELRMWRDYWSTNTVFMSDATRTNAVPYPDEYGYQHSYRPQSVTKDFCAVLREFKPTHIFVTHPSDANSDHRATANFVRLALLQLAEEGLQPKLYFYVIHFGDWPRPVHYHSELSLTPPTLLLDNGNWMTLPLSPAQTETKYQAILANTTQTTTREFFLVAFARANELFATIAPDRVPFLPAGPEPDWRQAVRAKLLTTVPDELHQQTDPPVTPQETKTIPLDTIEFARQNGDLIVIVGVRNSFGKHSGIHLILFPYQRCVPFEKMPKVAINIPPFGEFHVLVNGLTVRDADVTVTSVGNRFIVRMPMRVLGGKEIDHLFAAAQAHFGGIAADDTAWQLLELPVENKRNNHD